MPIQLGLRSRVQDRTLHFGVFSMSNRHECIVFTRAKPGEKSREKVRRVFPLLFMGDDYIVGEDKRRKRIREIVGGDEPLGLMGVSSENCWLAIIRSIGPAAVRAHHVVDPTFSLGHEFHDHGSFMMPSTIR